MAAEWQRQNFQIQTITFPKTTSMRINSAPGDTVKYSAYGEIRAGGTATDYLYTSQRNELEIGLDYYVARFYDPVTAHFIQADSLVPQHGVSTSFDRYAYVNWNPINFNDPSGNRACDTDGDCLKSPKANIVIDLYEYYDVVVSGSFSGSKVNMINEVVTKYSTAMGGAANFKAKLGGISFSEKKMEEGGLGSAHSVILNSDDSEISSWTVAHEITHAWDATNDWNLSKELEERTNGITDILSMKEKYKNGECPNNTLPGCNDAGYFYGGIPPKGSDINFNRMEDLAESVTAYLYPDIAKEFLTQNMSASPNLLYDDYSSSSRWHFVNNLMNRMTYYGR